MSWLVATAYVSAACLLAAGLLTRGDRLIRVRLGGALRSGQSYRTAVAWIGRRVPLRAPRRRLEALLEQAAVSPRDVDRIMGSKVVLCLSAGPIGLLAWPAGAVPAGVATLILASAGFRYPEFRLARRAAALRRRAAQEVPGLLDLLSVCVTAGLSPTVALERAAGSVHGPLGEALDRARKEVSLGRSWRGAVRAAADRLEVRDLRRLALALERGQRLGAPLAEQLRRLARDVRHERHAMAEERARRAPVLMLFPLVFLILPAFVLAAVIPALIVAARGIP